MTKFNDIITNEIIKDYSEGIHLKYCAEIVRINRSTIYRWRKRGEQEENGKYHDFYINMKRARAKYHLHHLTIITQSDDWKAHRYLLQVSDPEHYII